MKPLISVVTPIYNAEAYLEETILSVLEQTYKNIELILVNHNSTDGSDKIIQKYQKQDNRVKVITLDINKGGPAYPRNEGVKVSTGEYIAFVDSDDVWLPEKLEKQLACLQENKADIVHTLAFTIDKESTVIGDFQNQRVYNKLKYLMKKKSIIYYTNFININSVLMKKRKDMIFSEDINLVAMEDWKLWIEYFVENKEIILVEEKLLNYRILSNSASRRNSDIGYRKTLHLFSLMYLEKKISLGHYVLSSVLAISKIILKNFER